MSFASNTGHPAGFAHVLPRRARPRLVHQVVAHDVRVEAEALGDMPPRRRVAVLEADAVADRRVVVPEVVERALQRGHHEVVVREAALGLGREPVVDHRPVGPPLALEALVVEVLVEVEQRDDPVAAERVDGRADAVEVGVVVDARRGLDGLVDDPDAHGVVALGGEEGGVVVAEADRVRGVRRALVDHVQPVEDHDAAIGVGHPAARVADRQVGCRGRGGGGGQRDSKGCRGDAEGGAHSDIIPRLAAPSATNARRNSAEPAISSVSSAYIIG